MRQIQSFENERRKDILHRLCCGKNFIFGVVCPNLDDVISTEAEPSWVERDFMHNSSFKSPHLYISLLCTMKTTIELQRVYK